MLKKVIILTASVLVLYIAVGFTLTNIFLAQYFARVDNRGNFTTLLTHEHLQLQSQDVQFVSGENTLIGRVYSPAEPIGLLILIHGFGGDMESLLSQVDFFVQHDWKVLVYSGTGIAPSQGASRVSLHQAVTDLCAALNFVSTNADFSGLPIALFGHSQGGYAATAVLNYPEGDFVTAAVSFAGINHTGETLFAFGRSWIGFAYPLLHPFVRIVQSVDFGEYSAVSGINSRNIPVMLVQGGNDTFFPTLDLTITHSPGITNPNAEIIILQDYWNDGHISVLWSQDAFDYREEVHATFDGFVASLGIGPVNMTNEHLFEWEAAVGFDRFRMNGVDLALFGRIEEFLRLGEME
ncbi:MAG: lysophospholipase [Defluviitaleaceae bacterium]|nr:lysophospholipase [Defluviitaleaceae bacterium]